MFDVLIKIFKFLYAMFNALPEETQDKVKDCIYDIFDDLLREFFRSQQEGV